MPRSTHRVLIPLAAFLAILPMLLHGPSCGHDFDFHLLSWLEANTQLFHLQYPHWAYTPAYNAGEPRFVFYPPLSWLLGALLTSILPFPYVPIAFTFLALTAAGFALHRFASPYVTPAATTTAAVLYLLNPYMLFTAYERTAYAELLAAAFIPLLFAAILTPRPTIRGIAIPVALLWLTNAPAAVMGSYALAILTLCRLAGAPRLASETWGRTLWPRIRLAVTAACGTALGLALAAFYILPAAYERRFVQIAMANIPGMAPDDNTLFHHMALAPGVSPDDALAHDQVLHTASLIALILLAATALALFAASRNRRQPPPTPLPALGILTAIVVILLTPVSLSLWHHVPQLAFLQFPWRLLALVTPILAFAAATALARFPLRPLPCTLVLAAVLIPATWPQFRQACDAPDTPAARAALFHSRLGTEPTDEYTPETADNDALHQRDPPEWLLEPGSPLDSPAATGAAAGPAPDHLTVNGPGTLVLNRRLYPLWTILLNDHAAPSLERADGLIALTLPAGRDTVELTLRHPPDQILGMLLSILAAIILLALCIRVPVHSSRDASETL